MNATYEIIGYIASGLIVISLMMRSFLKLRTVNLLGAATMSIYGLLIKSYPVAILNAIIVAIDIYYLYEMFRPKDYFKLLKVRQNAHYLKHFLDYHCSEIRKFFPDFSYRESENQRVFFVLRNLIPAGLFIMETCGDDALFIKLDFVIPGYRDFKMGKFVYSKDSDIFKNKNVTSVLANAGSPKHAVYLKKMGFQLQNSAENLFCLKVA